MAGRSSKPASEPIIRIPLDPSNRLATGLMAWTVGISACLLIGTFAFRFYLAGPGFHWDEAGWPKVVLLQLNLSDENVVAAWFASMVLLAVGIGAALAFLVDRGSIPRPAWVQRLSSFGWLALAAAFVAMSLDEMGSLHERIALADFVKRLPPYWVDPPLVLALLCAGVMAPFAFLHIVKRPVVLGLMSLGIVIFIAAPAVELLEDWELEKSPLAPTWEVGTWAVAEEGVELLFSIVFLAAVIVYIRDAARDAWRSRAEVEGNVPSVVVRLRTAVWLAAAVGVLMGLGSGVSEILVARLPRGDKGIPSNWFTSAPAAVAAVGFAWCTSILPAPTTRHRRLYQLAAAFCTTVSLYYGASGGYWLSQLPHGHRFRLAAQGALIATAAALAWGLARADHRWWGRLTVIGWAILLSFGLADDRVRGGWKEAIAFGLLWVALLSHGANQFRGEAS